jgi:hypothetical protein
VGSSLADCHTPAFVYAEALALLLLEILVRRQYLTRDRGNSPITPHRYCFCSSGEE